MRTASTFTAACRTWQRSIYALSNRLDEYPSQGTPSPVDSPTRAVQSQNRRSVQSLELNAVHVQRARKNGNNNLALCSIVLETEGVAQQIKITGRAACY